MNYKFECPICKEVMEIVEEAVFEGRCKRKQTPEARVLEHLDLIFHEAEEGFRGYDIGVETGANTKSNSSYGG